MKLRKTQAKLVLFALGRLDEVGLTTEDSVTRANLVDRITDRFPSLTHIEEPAVSPTPRTRARKRTTAKK